MKALKMSIALLVAAVLLSLSACHHHRDGHDRDRDHRGGRQDQSQKY